MVSEQIFTKLFLVNTVLRNNYEHIYEIIFDERLQIGKKTRMFMSSTRENKRMPSAD